MNNWIMVGQHALNMAHVDRVMFPDDKTAIVFFNSLETRSCSECGDPTDGLEQSWLPLEGDDAVALRRYLGRVALDTRTPVPAVYHQQDS